MKRSILFLVLVAATFVACNGGTASETAKADSTAAVVTATPTPVDSSAVKADTTKAK